MVEATILRLRNIVSYKNELHYISMLSLDIDDEYTELIGLTKLGKNSNEISKWEREFGDDLVGVPLTEELLLKCNFIQHGEWLILNDINLPTNLSINISLSLKLVTLGANEEYQLDYFPYFHQVQNLYFAIAGEELQIKE